MKFCSKCEINKDLNFFYKNSKYKDGFNSRCKECLANYNNVYKSLNKDFVKKLNNSWKSNNRAIVNKQQREWRKNNPLSLKQRLALYLRNRLNSAIKYNFKGGSAVKNLGCSIQELKDYLESQFTENMTWDNYGVKGWHIDHIQPLANFNLSKIDELKLACHYTNLRPLWWYDNLSKGAK